MLTEKELQKLVKDYFTLKAKEKKMNEMDDKLWKDKDKVEKALERELKKKAKFPKSTSMKVGNYKIILPVSWGWLKIKKIK